MLNNNIIKGNKNFVVVVIVTVILVAVGVGCLIINSNYHISQYHNKEVE